MPSSRKRVTARERRTQFVPAGTDPGGPRRDRRRRSKTPTNVGMKRRRKTVNGNNEMCRRKRKEAPV